MPFNHSNFLSLMKDRKLQLPIIWEENCFASAVEQHLRYYLRNIEAILCEDDIRTIKRICNLINCAIKHYHNGFPTKAYNSFNRLMSIINKRPLAVYQKSAEHPTIFNDDPLILYRLRNVSENREYQRKELFHTPFNLRSKVATCRYSIAGYPCLYLGTTLELCRTEIMPVPDFQYSIASRFKIERNLENNNNQNIKVIELGIKPNHFIEYSSSTLNSEFQERLNEIDLSNNTVMYNYLFWYPVIASSSYIRQNRNDPFSSEYILPQLLMQWIRGEAGNKKLYGLRYFSCASIEASNLGLNYVFPVLSKTTQETNYCSILSDCFKLTKPKIFFSDDNIHEVERSLCKDYRTISI